MLPTIVEEMVTNLQIGFYCHQVHCSRNQDEEVTTTGRKGKIIFSQRTQFHCSLTLRKMKKHERETEIHESVSALVLPRCSKHGKYNHEDDIYTLQTTPAHKTRHDLEDEGEEPYPVLLPFIFTRIRYTVSDILVGCILYIHR